MPTTTCQAINKTDKNSCPHRNYILGEKRETKQRNEFTT